MNPNVRMAVGVQGFQNFEHPLHEVKILENSFFSSQIVSYILLSIFVEKLLF
jgi:hypothetical protein